MRTILIALTLCGATQAADKKAEAAVALQLAIERTNNDRAKAAVTVAVEASKEPSQREVYLGLRDRAVKEGKALVVFVQCERTEIPGAFTCRHDRLPDSPTPRIVVGVPDGQELNRVADLPAKATAGQIQAAMAPRKAAPSAPAS